MQTLLGLHLTQSYCSGYFSKDYDLYGAIVEAVGKDWIVLRLDSGRACFQGFADWEPEEVIKQLREWCSIPE